MSERLAPPVEGSGVSDKELQEHYDIPSATSPDEAQKIFDAVPVDESYQGVEAFSQQDEHGAERSKGESRELLRGSRRVGAEIHNVGNRTIEKIRLGVAKTANFLTSPKKAWREFTRNRAERAVSRKRARLEELEHSDLSTGFTTGRNLLKAMRQRKLDQAQEKLGSRQKLYDDYVEVRQSREARVKDSAAEKREAYVGKLVEKKQIALAQKEIRNRLKAEGVRRSERKEVLEVLSAAQLSEVGKAAIRLEEAQRYHKRAVRKEEQGAKKYQSAEEGLRDAQQQVESYKKLIESKERELEEFNADAENVAAIKSARQRISRLTGSVEALNESQELRAERERAISEQYAVIFEMDKKAENIKSEIAEAEKQLSSAEQRAAKRQEALEVRTSEFQDRSGAAAESIETISDLRRSVDEALSKLDKEAGSDEQKKPASENEKKQEPASDDEQKQKLERPSGSQPTTPSVSERFDGGYEVVEKILQTRDAIHLMKANQSFGVWVDRNRDRFQSLDADQQGRLEDLWAKHKMNYNKK